VDGANIANYVFSSGAIEQEIMEKGQAQEKPLIKSSPGTTRHF
jgi:hypothetical protein